MELEEGDNSGYLIFGEKDLLDPSGLINQDSFDFFVNGDRAEASDLKGQELARHSCRHQYDLFELADGFCC